MGNEALDIPMRDFMFFAKGEPIFEVGVRSKGPRPEVLGISQAMSCVPGYIAIQCRPQTASRHASLSL